MESKTANSMNLIILWLVLMAVIAFFSLGYHWFINPTLMDFAPLIGGIIVIILPALTTVMPLILVALFERPIMKSAAISLGIFLSILLVANTSAYMYFGSFTQDKWNEFEHHRYLMVNDLERKHSLVGMSRDEVLELLGNSYWEDDGKHTADNISFWDMNHNGEHTIKYWTNESKYRGNYYILYLEDGIVIQSILNKETWRQGHYE